MNRREMLSAAVAVPLAIGVTSSARGGTVTSVSELLRKIESQFECVDGLPRAYFEGVYPLGHFGRVIYMLLVNGVAQLDGNEVSGLKNEALAVNALWMTFQAYAVGKKGKLFWRKKPEVKVVTPEEMMRGRGLVETLPGRWQSHESAEDGTLARPKTAAEWGEPRDKYYARMRLVITDLMPFTEEEDSSSDGTFKVDPKTGEVWQRHGRVSI